MKTPAKCAEPNGRERAKNASSKPRVSAGSAGDYDLRLYVAGATPKSVAALRNLEKLCEAHLSGRYRIEVIDLTKKPHLAHADQILAVPTLVRNLPRPVCKLVGTLSDTERVLASLELDGSDAGPFPARKGGKSGR